MRTHIGFFALLAFCAAACPAKESATTPVQKVRFGDSEFEFAYEGKTTTSTFKEYIPKGESLDHWTKLVGIYKYPNINDPEAMAQKMEAALKQQNPLAHSALGFNPNTNTAVLDFITWPRNVEFAEFNIFKFERDGKNGLIAYQYAERAYEDRKEFLTKRLTVLRKEAFVTMTHEGVVIVQEPRPKTGSRQQIKQR